MADDSHEFEACLGNVLSGLENRGYKFILKDEQKTALKNLFFGRDTICILPTGFGKSLIFQLLVLAKCEKFRQEGGKTKASLLVVCPLNSLMKDQVLEVSDMGISATFLPEAKPENLKRGDYEIVYTSPESILDKKFLAVPGVFHNSMVAVVIDEAHTLETWTGKRQTSGKGETKAFRKAFGELATLRSFCKEGTPILALTGTADETTLKIIKEDLLLKQPMTLFVSPTRDNLRFSVKKVKQDVMMDELTWLITMAKEKGVDCPKTIIFCNTLNDIAAVYNHLILKLGKHAYAPVGADQHEDLILGVYHSTSFDSCKDRIVKSLKGEGKKRIVIASTALSMGVNFPNIHYVINWGPARNLLDQLQEAGRAGRDGKQAHVVVVYHGRQLAHCSKDVKLFVNTGGCYRKAAYGSLDPAVEPLSIQHDCCNFCSKTCTCQGTSCNASFLYEQNMTERELGNSLNRPVSDEDKRDLKDALEEVMLGLSATKLSVFDMISTHGFSAELIHDIVRDSHKIFTVSDIISCFPVYSVSHAFQILEIIQDIFMDIPEINMESASSLIVHENLNVFAISEDFWASLEDLPEDFEDYTE